MENRNPGFFYTLAAFLACTLFLAGCSVIPIRTSPKYALEDLYKRINYRTDGRYRVVSLFYATTRTIDYAQGPSPEFKPELAGETTYGSLDVRMDPRLKIGTMLPDKLKKNGLIELDKNEKLDGDVFIERLSAAIKASPHKSILIVVFGYKDGFESTAMKAAYFEYMLDFNTPVLLFDWPGDQPLNIGGYLKARSLAAASGPRLADVIARVVREIAPEKVWITASSLGCQVVSDAFDTLYTYPDFADPGREIDHVLLAAPDVSRDEFDDKFKKEFDALSKNLTAYVASDDNALLMSGLINQEEKLGRPRVRIKDPEQLEETRGLLYLKSLDPERFTVIDVTPVNKSSFKHGYCLECPEFYDDFYMRILGAKPNVNRSLYLLKFKNDADYWVMQSAD
ncbi:MAG: alpha/beta hydrolase [Candidatus Omnitrophota bacterium]